MEKRIIGYRLVKEYPGVGLPLNSITNSNNELHEKWPCFWEPVYEEKGVNLLLIMKKDGGFNLSNIYTITAAERVMKEACRQTLELVIKEFAVTEEVDHWGPVEFVRVNCIRLRNLMNLID